MKSEFDYLSQVTIGQYLPGDSPLHRLDPRLKLLMALLWIGAATISGSLRGLGLGLAVIVAAFALARVPLRFALRGVRTALPFLLVLALLQILVIPQKAPGAMLWRWWQLAVTTGGLYAAALLLTRFASLILTISLLSFTTTTTGLMHGAERVLQPLQGIGLPAHEFALALNIALRSVPLLAQEAERIAKAQAARGGDFGRGRGGILRRVQQVMPLLLPLFLSALQRAERLALAMEARGYMGGKGRTHLIELRAQPSDWLALGLMLPLCVLLFL